MKKEMILLLLVTLFVTTGCAVNIYKKSPKANAKIEELSSEVTKLSKLREREREDFEKMKRELQGKLKGRVGLAVAERGLVITLANNILFDSGRAKIKKEAYPVLDKITKVIKKRAADKNIGIEGHTDDTPIKYSSWKSNRELSTARANNVYHYLVDTAMLKPSKLTTIGYGQFRPVASNNTAKGRAKNRRVEIVILPQYPRKSIGELEEQAWVK
ncbi:MAG: OmpA family protein [Candidatus Omnitrophota bacterium]|nr:MAG: OmpA family protein [Candidatus Omnitrophota bacterium]